MPGQAHTQELRGLTAPSSAHPAASSCSSSVVGSQAQRLYQGALSSEWADILATLRSFCYPFPSAMNLLGSEKCLLCKRRKGVSITPTLTPSPSAPLTPPWEGSKIITDTNTHQPHPASFPHLLFLSALISKALVTPFLISHPSNDGRSLASWLLGRSDSC